EHPMAGTAPGGPPLRVRPPLLLESGHPIVGEPPGVEPALSPAVVEAEVGAAVAPGIARDEPDPGVGVGPILVVAEEDVLAIGHHDDRARGDGAGREGDERQGPGAPAEEEPAEATESRRWPVWSESSAARHARVSQRSSRALASSVLPSMA